MSDRVIADRPYCHSKIAGTGTGSTCRNTHKCVLYGPHDNKNHVCKCGIEWSEA